MSQTDRIYHIHRTLARRRTPIPLRRLAEDLEVSAATVKRDVEKLRDMGAPIPPGNRSGGTYYDADSPEFELPSLWFNQTELYALLATEQLLEAGQPGLLNLQLGRLKGRVRQLLGTSGFEAATVHHRIHLQPMDAQSLSGIWLSASVRPGFCRSGH